MRISLYWPIGIAFLMTSCTDRPLVEPRPVTYQQKFQTSEHWQQLASTNAQQISTALKNTPDPKQGGHIILGKNGKMPTLSNRPYYVSYLNSDAPFGRAYRDFLIEELIKRNHTISTISDNATVINIRVQVLEYGGPNRAQTIPGIYGTLSSLGYLANQSKNWSFGTSLLAGIGLGTVLDVFSFISDTPNAEVVILTAVIGENSYHYLKTDRYYLSLIHI